MADDEKEQPATALPGNGAAVNSGAPATAASETAASETAATSEDAVAFETAAAPGTAEPVDDLTALRAELEHTRDRLLRERAELENYKKRTTREKADALLYGNERLLRDLLPVIDNLERALQHVRSVEGGDAVVEGIELVRCGLVETLERHGVRVVKAEGTVFDPMFHEAIGYVESEHPPNTVIDEHQRGYALHDRLLRPALVTVGKGPSETSAQDPAQDRARDTAQNTVEKPQDDG